MTPQKIRTKHAAQGLVASIMLVIGFITGAVFLAISAITDHPATYMTLAVIAYLLVAAAVVIGVATS